MIIFSQIRVSIVMKPGIKLIFVYIALTQYLDRDDDDDDDEIAYFTVR